MEAVAETVCDSLRHLADVLESRGTDRIEWVSVAYCGQRCSVRLKEFDDLRKMFPGESATKTKYTDSSHKFSVVVDDIQYWAVQWFEHVENPESETVTL